MKQKVALTEHPNIHTSDLVSIRPFPLWSTSGAMKFKFLRAPCEVTGPSIARASIAIVQFVNVRI